MTNWKELIESEMKAQEETFEDVVECTLTEEQLMKTFDCGYGGTEGEPFTLWTTNRVYFPSCHDGAEWVESVSCNPDGKSDMTNTPIVPEETIKEWERLRMKDWVGYISPEPDFRQLCQELVDDLDSWMEFDERPSMLWQEYDKSMNLIRKVRNALKKNQHD